MTTDKQLTIPKLKNKLNSLVQYSEKYSKNKLFESDDIQSTLKQQEYKIGVVANMSAGKSTFINALFGAEILPAYSHATTDCATFIYSESKNDKKAIIYFNDGKQSVELGENGLSEIREYAQKDEECKDDKYKNVEKIDLYYPFKNIQTSVNEDFKILFVDTPGPNSTGGNYQQKHKDQTRAILRDVDLALFLFDYEQLDANLTSDEQGLWTAIKKRHEAKDKDFEVYFLLNKIDGAFEDNFKDIDTKDKDKFIEEKRKNWFIGEQKAIDKLKQAAINHGINDPKIYPISSKFTLYKRDVNINCDKEDDLDDFERKHFRRLFPDKWEEELIKYLGISKLEENINHHINITVKEKIANNLSNKIQDIIKKENNELRRMEETLKKPKEEAEKNLRNVKEFLNNRSKALQYEMKSDSSIIHIKYFTEIQNQITNAISNELRSKTEELTKRTIYFAQRYARDPKSISTATQQANEIPLQNMEINLNVEIAEILLSNSIPIDNVMNEMQNYMINLLHSYKNNYLDIKADIKESYHSFYIESSQLLKKYKTELEENLNKVLEIKIEEIQTDELDFSIFPSMNIKVPNSVLDYKFENAQYETVSDSTWWNPFSWGNTKKVKIKNEKHVFSIYPKELLESIQKSVESSIDSFYLKEVEMHEKTIKNHLDKFLTIFQNFRHEKEKEMIKLSEEIKNGEDNIKKLELQKKEFQQLQSEG